MKATLPIEIPRSSIADFCRRWKIEDLSLFGSVLRDDFRPDSDVDVLVTFSPETRWGLFDLVQMQDELAAIVGRKVDLVDRTTVERSENHIRRKNILGNCQPFYVAE